MTAEEFKIICIRLNMTHKDVAKYLKLSYSTVCNWAQGRVRIPYMAELILKNMLEQNAEDIKKTG